MGRFVDSVENLLLKVMPEVTGKIEDFLKFKNIDTLNDDTRAFLNQFQFNTSFKQYKNISGQINALKNKYYYIEAQDIHLGVAPVEKFNKETQRNETVLKDVYF